MTSGSPSMKSVRQTIGGLGNLMFKQAFIYAQFRKGWVDDLYLQSPKYWSEFRDEVRAMFSEGIPGKNDKVSLHIRLGDYVNNPFYVNLMDTGYYQQAVALFPNKEFLVFCKDNQGRDPEDRHLAKRFVDSLDIKYKFAPSNLSETDDLNLMASCEAHIGANSSFSWWGAFLGGGEAIFPSQWFTDGVKRIDLMPEWKTI